ncbi:MAG: hypothetical protein KC733_11995 [Candidatus Omnitrophica bacterium]|nr:hypothetical protein [Candidatus Omnitrophota bacterium]
MITNTTTEILAHDIHFNAESGNIEYILPQDALVRLRIGVKNGGMLIDNLLDWEYRSAGRQIEHWDHKDSSRTVDFSGHQDLMLALACLPVEEQQRQKYQGPIKGFRQSPKLNIVFPSATKTILGEIPVLEKIAPIRITIAPEDQQWLTETKYEIGMFLDGIFLLEDEEGNNPYTYQLNTAGLNPGQHYLTVNVVGYEGEVGTLSRYFTVKQ